MTRNQTYKLELLIKAQTWDEVVQIMKDELGLHEDKRPTSLRNIQDLFMFEIALTTHQLTDGFYKAIKKSNKIAILSSPLCSEQRAKILESSYEVEKELRKLLLHVSDIADEYYEKVLKTSYTKNFSDKQSAILSDSLEPVTSHLTFGDMISILDIDLSWKNRTLSAEDLLKLTEKYSDTKGISAFLKTKLKSNSVWNLIAKYVLKNPIEWESIKPELFKLKSLRDRAAHFQIVTDADSKKAEKLSKSIIERIDTKRVTNANLEKLHKATFEQFSEALSYNASKAAEAVARHNLAIDKAIRSLSPSISQTQSIAASMVKATERHALTVEALRRRLEEGL